MAQRLYNVGLLDQGHRTKSKEINSQSLPVNLQHMGVDDHRLEQQFRAIRHLSSPSSVLTRQTIFRNGYTSLPGLSLHIQSMKKSAFKMLCKYHLLSKRKTSLNKYFHEFFWLIKRIEFF
jgi:hypothetical protein